MLRAKAPAREHAHSLLPIPGSQINGLTGAHVVHNLLDAPGLVLVAPGVVGLERIFIFHVDTFLHAFCALGVVLVGVGFWVVAPNPLGKLGLRTAGIELDFVPVGVLEKFSVGKAELLCA
jgi:hypothetical protein